MKRDLGRLTGTQFDLVVIGGGIYGAFVAWDAVLRGLRVALLEKDDFGAATSANSLKIIHGGLRYLRDGNFPLMRRMIAERATWQRIAPRFVQPLSFIMPTYRHPARHRLPLAAAMALNNWLTRTHNQDLPASQQLPDGGLLSRAAYAAECGWIDPAATGGARWWDVQMIDSERLLLAIIAAAAAAGAVVANHVEVTGLQLREGVARGLRARDNLSGAELAVAARLTVNCAGAWAGQLLVGATTPVSPPPANSIAINLVTRALPLPCAVGVTSRTRVSRRYPVALPRTIFLTPWRDHTLIGTMHAPIAAGVNQHHARQELLEAFVDGVNEAFPPAELQLQDVDHVHIGFLPLAPGRHAGVEAALLRTAEVRDHAAVDGIENLISVFGVKYTMARMTAERTVDLALDKLNVPWTPSRTDQMPVAEVAAAGQGQSPAGVDCHTLAQRYGALWRRVADLAASDPSLAAPLAPDVISAEVIHAVRYEMACTLADVVRRRLPLGAGAPPDGQTLATCARLMASELGWDNARAAREIDQVTASYPLARIAEALEAV